ncbi:hypothetical protein O6H91_14G050400 [Diphasiastrum complanatum]|uniref:Uncharacterized protein n=4 Tax=Diphasiastrum complanatum TaxID=34168 RepID=A0ACC2BMM9_DIPCM|nr:hypothetical protein O6H91_14G027400 [Diphasiastrum complanatum]KAJ7530990.1 hypothetical protein O6H91_14G027400 [Diphasiastrum complanatum]KAJ7530991.1 hypothetical protein O6H91_14G027400 [Diphasiastrum complanatum]KAJ7531603.1 hypothetical protein O6H91_14G050400 [Diphasiastrum complanatum]
MRSVNAENSKILPHFLSEGSYLSKNNKNGRKGQSYKTCPRCIHIVLLLSLFTFVLTSAAELLWIWSNDRNSGFFRRESSSGEVATNPRYINEEHIQIWPDVSKAMLEKNPDVFRRLTTGGEDGKGDRITNLSVIQEAPPSKGDFNPLHLSSRIRVYVYELPAKFNQDWLSNPRCSSHLFAAEVALHRILLKSSVRTLLPEDADFYFVPVYVACNFSTKNGFPSLQHARTLLQSAVELISKDMPYWNKSNGRDHVFVATHDFGACFHAMEDVAVAAGIPHFMKNSIILQTFAKKDDNPCQQVDYIQIPPYVVPPNHDPVWQDLGKQNRDICVYFRGKMEVHPKNISGRIYSRGVRTAIWQRFAVDKTFFIKRKRSENYQYEMLRSNFCLCPLGWAPWSPRIVESVVYGCVPVIIADNIALPFSHAINWKKISLTVAERDVHKLDKILLQISKTNLSAIQNHLWKEHNRRVLLYTDPLVQGDATWQILDQLSLKKNRSSKVQLDLT